MALFRNWDLRPRHSCRALGHSGMWETQMDGVSVPQAWPRGLWIPSRPGHVGEPSAPRCPVSPGRYAPLTPG